MLGLGKGAGCLAAPHDADKSVSLPGRCGTVGSPQLATYVGRSPTNLRRSRFEIVSNMKTTSRISSTI